jgi:flagellar biosynthesis protein FlhG
MADQAEMLRQMVADQHRQERQQKMVTRQGRQEILAVASGKGGVGKTSLSVNLGISLYRQGKRALILDCDLGLSNVNILMGELPKYNLFHVLKGERQLTDIIYTTRYGIDIIAGASGFNELANLTGSERQRFIDKLDALSRYEYIILDVGAGIGANVTSFLYAADRILIVTTPEPTAVTDAYGIIKVLANESRTLDIGLIVNKVETVAEGRKVAERIIGIARQYLSIEVTNVGLIYRDRCAEEALYKRVPYLIHDPKAKCSISVEAIAARLQNLPYEHRLLDDGSVIKNFFKTIFG